MAEKLQIHGRLLMIISFVIVLNIEKKKQWKNLWSVAQSTNQNYLRHVKSVIIIIEKKMKDKIMNWKMNGTGMGIE